MVFHRCDCVLRSCSACLVSVTLAQRASTMRPIRPAQPLVRAPEVSLPGQNSLTHLRIGRFDRGTRLELVKTRENSLKNSLNSLRNSLQFVDFCSKFPHFSPIPPDFGRSAARPPCPGPRRPPIRGSSPPTGRKVSSAKGQLVDKTLFIGLLRRGRRREIWLISVGFVL